MAMASDSDSELGDDAPNVPLMAKREAATHNLDNDELPTPAVQTDRKSTRFRLPAALIIPIWMSFSAGVIIYNKFIYSRLHYPYPIFLITWHLVFATIGTRILKKTTRLLDGVKDVQMTKEKYFQSILPIGILMSGSLILSNAAYLQLSVSFIQMLKAFNPVCILLISFMFHLQDPEKRLIGIVFMISIGVSIAAYGEIDFNLLGFILQTLAVVFESSRLVMIQILLHEQKMDPLVSLHYFAPACAAINIVFLIAIEGRAPFVHMWLVGPWLLISNAFVAFGLNIAAVYLIGAASGLVLTLAGVLKDILMIGGSVLLFGDAITGIQIVGYGIALCGLVLYKTTSAATSSKEAKSQSATDEDTEPSLELQQVRR